MLQQFQKEMGRGCKNSRLNRNILKTLRVIIDKIHVLVEIEQGKCLYEDR